ncbi:terpene synthase family protein [Umezawaea endophytica]|uniref:Terpene synthase n=1 Tax=Umezawaea endophytica TaxID=1654476 RepID=A0A9X2VV18_9PSEU|nr:terpene synthase family protein [Umezawaea endophytica]MCS7482862.1 terpene synthase family protein [Umezawaea endophytica]
MTRTDGVPTLSLPFDGGRFEPDGVVRDRVRAVRERLEAASLGRYVQGDDVMVDLICRTSPQADADTIGPVAEWLLWVFPFDDLCEEVFAADNTIELLDADATGLARHLVATALPQAVAEGMTGFCRDVTAHRSPGWTSRFLRDLDTYVLHAIRYAGTSADDLPALDEFVVLRREEGAAKPTVDLVEVAAGVDLPEEFRNSPSWQRLHDACADVLTWTNDIYSHQKERHAGNRFNLVDVLVRHTRLSEDEARARAVDMTNEKAREFTAGAAELVHGEEFRSLTERTRSDVVRCVRGMEHWMRGQYEWFVITGPARYRVGPRG